MHFLKTILTLLICIVVMQYLHELGHAAMAKALGYDVLLTVNKVHSSGAVGAVPLWHSQFIALAGPAVTIALSIVAFVVRNRLGELALIVTFNAMIMRMIATVVSVSHPNDEAWVSASLGIGLWTLPVLGCAGLLGIFFLAWREERPSWTWYVCMWAGVSIGYSAIVFAESSFPQFSF